MRIALDLLFVAPGVAGGRVYAEGLLRGLAAVDRDNDYWCHVRRDTRLPFVFPVLALAGGLLLLVHSHAAFETKSSYLVQVTHTAMGLLAVLIACTRLLELRLAPSAGRAAGAASSVAMLLVALVLVFYREANVLVPLP